MAWEWSHTQEAYGNAHDNLHNKPREWLNECLAEWQASRRGPYGDYNLRMNRYDKTLAWCAALPADDIVADAIWDKAQEHATCDNGGFNAHMCPYGCHTVSFDCEEVEA